MKTRIVKKNNKFYSQVKHWLFGWGNIKDHTDDSFGVYYFEDKWKYGDDKISVSRNRIECYKIFIRKKKE